MNQPDGTPRRVRVTNPRTSAARARRVLPTAEIDRRSRLGELYVSTLLRAQLRLALGVLAVAVGTLAGLPLLFLLVPGLSDVALLGMPLSWVLLAFVAYPFLFLCGWSYVRRAERNEAAFAAMVEPREGERS